MAIFIFYMDSAIGKGGLPMERPLIEQQKQIPMSSRIPVEEGIKATWRDYLSVTKPGLIPPIYWQRLLGFGSQARVTRPLTGCLYLIRYSFNHCGGSGFKQLY